MDSLNVKTLREALGLTRVEFAALVPIDPATVWRWEEGESEPTPLAKVRLAEIAKTKPKIHKVGR